jgi:hypothetical protein
MASAGEQWNSPPKTFSVLSKCGPGPAPTSGRAARLLYPEILWWSRRDRAARDSTCRKGQIVDPESLIGWRKVTYVW